MSHDVFVADIPRDASSRSSASICDIIAHSDLGICINDWITFIFVSTFVFLVDGVWMLVVRTTKNCPTTNVRFFAAFRMVLASSFSLLLSFHHIFNHKPPS